MNRTLSRAVSAAGRSNSRRRSLIEKPESRILAENARQIVTSSCASEASRGFAPATGIASAPFLSGFKNFRHGRGEPPFTRVHGPGRRPPAIRPALPARPSHPVPPASQGATPHAHHTLPSQRAPPREPRHAVRPTPWRAGRRRTPARGVTFAADATPKAPAESVTTGLPCASDHGRAAGAAVTIYLPCRAAREGKLTRTALVYA